MDEEFEEDVIDEAFEEEDTEDESDEEEEDMEEIMDMAQWGDLEGVRRLVQQDRRLLEATNGHHTVLTMAAREGRVGVVRWLLDEGAEVNRRAGATRSTALHAACGRGQVAVVSLLLERGADATINYYDENPLSVASRFGCASVVQALLAHGCGHDHRDRTGQTAVHRASARGRVDVLRLLLEAGADPTIPINAGKTPLQIAASSENIECVALLMVSDTCSIKAAGAYVQNCSMIHSLGRAGVGAGSLPALQGSTPPRGRLQHVPQPPACECAACGFRAGIRGWSGWGPKSAAEGGGEGAAGRPVDEDWQAEEGGGGGEGLEALGRAPSAGRPVQRDIHRVAGGVWALEGLSRAR